MGALRSYVYIRMYIRLERGQMGGLSGWKDIKFTICSLQFHLPLRQLLQFAFDLIITFSEMSFSPFQKLIWLPPSHLNAFRSVSPRGGLVVKAKRIFMKSIKIIDIYGGVINAHTHKHSPTLSLPMGKSQRKIAKPKKRNIKFGVCFLFFFCVPQRQLVNAIWFWLDLD